MHITRRFGKRGEIARSPKSAKLLPLTTQKHEIQVMNREERQQGAEVLIGLGVSTNPKPISTKKNQHFSSHQDDGYMHSKKQANRAATQLINTPNAAAKRNALNLDANGTRGDHERKEQEEAYRPGTVRRSVKRQRNAISTKKRQDSVLPTIIRVGGRGDQDSPRGPSAAAQEDEQPCGPGRSRHSCTASPLSLSLRPSPTGLQQWYLSLPLSLSLSCPLFLPYRAMEMARKLLSRLKNPAFWPQYSILNFLGVFLVFCSFGAFLIARSALLNSLG